MKDALDSMPTERTLEQESFANRKLIRPSLTRNDHNHNHGNHMQQLFQFFRAGAKEIDVLAAAMCAVFGHRRCVSAVVAFHPAIALVVRHRDSAVFAFKFLAAGPAQNDRRVPSAVEENHHLLAFFETFTDFLGEFARDHLLLSGFLKLLAHDHLNPDTAILQEADDLCCFVRCDPAADAESYFHSEIVRTHGLDSPVELRQALRQFITSVTSKTGPSTFDSLGVWRGAFCF